MAKAKYNENAAIRGAIRRTFSRSPVVRQVLQKVRREVPRYCKDGTRAKKDSVQYQCQTCKEYVGSTKVAVDHIEPVIEETGFVDWNTFVTRLFCGPENLAPICETCHKDKTNRERRARQLIKDRNDFEELSKKSVLDDTEAKKLKRLRKKLSDE